MDRRPQDHAIASTELEAMRTYDGAVKRNRASSNPGVPQFDLSEPVT